MKLKRLFTAALSAVLALSLCAMPAMAADDTTTPVKTSTSTIDTQKEGSITIYKRALDSGEKEGDHGDGETMTGKPQGTALKDTGFTLYQVMDTDALLAYYNDAAKAGQVDVKSYFTKYEEDNTAKGLIEKYQTPYKTQILTDENGMAAFTKLPVGMYLVIETKTPQAVTVPVEPFLVSIPMTRIGDTAADVTTNQNQKQWLYDVTVYPKNSIAKGNVKLVKLGKQGDDEPTPLAGVIFTLFKKNDIDDEYTSVQTEDPMETNAKGEIALTGLTKGRYYLLETGYAANKDTGYILNTGKFYFDINGDGKAVMVNDDTITDKVKDDSFAIDTTGTTLTVTNYKPDIEKTVTTRDDKKAHQADYGVGDDVQYTLTIKVPENVASLKTFKVTDTTVASQLVQKKDSVQISGKNSDGTAVSGIAASSITVAPDKTNSVMTVDFTPSTLTDVAGGEITIAYTATVQSGAVVAGNGNVNTAKIVYSRKTGTETEGNDPYEITDKGVVYTFSLKIHKTGKGSGVEKQNLEGVTFDLYKNVDTETPDGDGKYPFCGNKYIAIRGEDAVTLGLATNDTEKWIQVKTLLRTDKDGCVSVMGLPSGTYKLVETQTVEGYNLLSKPVDAKLNLTYATEWKTTKEYDEKGNQTKNETNTTTYTRGNNETVANPANETIEIINRKGFTLPVTGGFGTLLFSGIGVLLVLAGVGVLFSLKKKSNRA